MQVEWRDKIRFLPFFTSDFFGDGKVTRMTGQERAIYLLLLMTIWNSEEKYWIQADDSEIIRALQIDHTIWNAVKGRVLGCFLHDEHNGMPIYVNKRLKEELDKAVQRSESARESAKMRWHSKRKANAKRTQSDGNAKTMRSVCYPNPNPNIKKNNIIYGEEKWGFTPDPNKKRYKDLVYLTDEEYAKLHRKYGPLMERILEILDGWKENAGPKKGHYKSDYKAILQWVGSRAEEEFAKAQKKPAGSQPQPYQNRPRQEDDVPRTVKDVICDKCDRPTTQTVDYRGMKLCRSCYDDVKPAMPTAIRDLLSGTGKEVI